MATRTCKDWVWEAYACMGDGDLKAARTALDNARRIGATGADETALLTQGRRAYEARLLGAFARSSRKGRA